MDRSRSAFQARFRQHFGFEPTESQAEAMERLTEFIYGKGDNFLFQLSGYAGTGNLQEIIKNLQTPFTAFLRVELTGKQVIFLDACSHHNSIVCGSSYHSPIIAFCPDPADWQIITMYEINKCIFRDTIK